MKRLFVLLVILCGCNPSLRQVSRYCSTAGVLSCNGDIVEVCTSGGWRQVDDCAAMGLRCGLVFNEGREVMACKE